MSRDEILERFRLEAVSASPGTFDYAKLDWMNGVYLRALEPGPFADEVVRYLRGQGLDWPEDRVRAMAPLVQEKVGRLGEIPGSTAFLFAEVEPDPDAPRPTPPGRGPACCRRSRAGTPPRSRLRKGLCEELGEKPRTVFAPIRLAVTGSRVSLGLYESLESPRAGDLARADRTRGGARGMSVRTVDEFEQRLEAYAIERSEEARAVRVGEKDVSEQAAIVARYADLFSRDSSRRSAMRRRALPRTSARRSRGSVSPARRGSSPRSSPSARTRSRTPSSRHACRDGSELPLRAAQARLAVEPDYARRGSLGDAILRRPRRSTTTAETCSPPGTSSSRRSRESPTRSPATRPRRACASARSSTRSTRRASRRRRRSRRSASAGSTGCSGPEREEVPASAHMAWVRRLSPLESTYTKERSARLPRHPRGARASTSRPPRGSAPTSTTGRRRAARLRDRLRPAARRPPDHPRAGRAARLRGLPARGRARPPLRRLRGLARASAFRRLSRDHALTEIYSFLLDSIVREPRGTPSTSGSPTPRRARTPMRRGSRTRSSTAATRRSSATSSSSGPGSRAAARSRTATPSGSPRRPGSATPRRTTSPTWTPASTRPTT